ncbi:hypothetical protein SEA_LITTLELAF_96 [Mycobacterium phage LittleLaf]|uniref:Uncharacterized protein n=5 Tax=Marvinvirus marvin TaxID=1982092 RepID=A0A3G8FF66_9CAUD|nr:hypothetical protein SEA_LITTLELAF_96 [Mycobacterium phage LittleLaf]AYB70728.1 hypothetical protein SEA_VASUNZINGA_96 [Mycobacterium phage VasuNzinga]AZF93385.1 hypothetical protein SEA_BEELZEBUB_102 [Mycobacterium phage Beelzebub]QFP96973.1 hypothetical protein SEA_PRINGAR_94 [Mycobacterium phage Pringar]QFP97648.1 hypothetical protein SEA_CORAZON_93 [Mycobacterium phage Corazon]URP22591.1 hypothetical protein SEA_HUPHLEPUFF_100 [Mycobacterium phage Huphlepuff]WAA20203.1 hypothetical pro
MTTSRHDYNQLIGDYLFSGDRRDRVPPQMGRSRFVVRPPEEEGGEPTLGYGPDFRA